MKLKKVSELFRFSCEFCGSAFKSLKTLDIHILDKHDGISGVGGVGGLEQGGGEVGAEKMLYKCDVCGLQAGSEHEMKIHRNCGYSLYIFFLLRQRNNESKSIQNTAVFCD